MAKRVRVVRGREVIEPKHLKTLAEQSGKTVEEALELWVTAQESVEKDYPAVKPKSPRYYRLVNTVWKGSLGIKDEPKETPAPEPKKPEQTVAEAEEEGKKTVARERKRAAPKECPSCEVALREGKCPQCGARVVNGRLVTGGKIDAEETPASAAVETDDTDDDDEDEGRLFSRTGGLFSEGGLFG